MSVEQHEKVMDVVAYIRKWAEELPDNPDDHLWFERTCEDMVDILNSLADRLEKAWKFESREIELNAAPPSCRVHP